MKRTGALTLLLLPGFATAQTIWDEPSYHYLETALIDVNIDAPGQDLEGDGYTFEYSFDVRDHVHLFGAYESFDLEDVDGDGARKLFGAGAHFTPFGRLGVFGRIAYTDIDMDAGMGNVGDDGLTVIGGVRYLIGNGWEVRGGAEYVNLDDGGSETFVTAGGDLYLTEVVALTLDFDARDDATVTTLGFRFYFDNDPDPR